MPFSHILDLRERRAAYANLLQALYSGTAEPIDGRGIGEQIADLTAKIEALDVLIEADPHRTAPEA